MAYRPLPYLFATEDAIKKQLFVEAKRQRDLAAGKRPAPRKEKLTKAQHTAAASNAALAKIAEAAGAALEEDGIPVEVGGRITFKDGVNAEGEVASAEAEVLQVFKNGNIRVLCEDGQKIKLCVGDFDVTGRPDVGAAELGPIKKKQPAKKRPSKKPASLQAGTVKRGVVA